MTAPSDLHELAQGRVLIRSGVPRAVRKKLGLSLAEVAASVGVTRSSVLRWETGETAPRSAAALRYVAEIRRLRRLAARMPDEVTG